MYLLYLLLGQPSRVDENIYIYIEEGRYHGQDRSLEEGAGGEGLVTGQEDVENSRDTLETVQPYLVWL